MESFKDLKVGDIITSNIDGDMEVIMFDYYGNGDEMCFKSKKGIWYAKQFDPKDWVKKERNAKENKKCVSTNKKIIEMSDSDGYIYYYLVVDEEQTTIEYVGNVITDSYREYYEDDDNVEKLADKYGNVFFYILENIKEKCDKGVEIINDFITTRY